MRALHQEGWLGCRTSGLCSAGPQGKGIKCAHLYFYFNYKHIVQLNLIGVNESQGQPSFFPWPGEMTSNKDEEWGSSSGLLAPPTHIHTLLMAPYTHIHTSLMAPHIHCGLYNICLSFIFFLSHVHTLDLFFPSFTWNSATAPWQGHLIISSMQQHLVQIPLSSLPFSSPACPPPHRNRDREWNSEISVTSTTSSNTSCRKTFQRCDCGILDLENTCHRDLSICQRSSFQWHYLVPGIYFVVRKEKKKKTMYNLDFTKNSLNKCNYS